MRSDLRQTFVRLYPPTDNKAAETAGVVDAFRVFECFADRA